MQTIRPTNNIKIALAAAIGGILLAIIANCVYGSFTRQPHTTMRVYSSWHYCPPLAVQMSTLAAKIIALTLEFYAYYRVKKEKFLVRAAGRPITTAIKAVNVFCILAIAFGLIMVFVSCSTLFCYMVYDYN